MPDLVPYQSCPVCKSRAYSTGIDIAGPLPGDLQETSIFAAAVMVGNRDAAAAKALIDFLRTPEAAKTIKAKGMEPVVR